MSKHRRGRSPARVAIPIVAVIAVVLVASYYVLGDQGVTARQVHAQPTSRPHADHHSDLPATFVGPYGVESRAIIAQNQLPGTTAWRITTPQTGTSIEGYTNRPQARLGQTVDVYVSTTASSYRIEAFRMGYYQGKGARLVWRSKQLPGTVQPSCPASPPLYMVQCNWSLSDSFKVTKAFFPGDYLLKLVGNGGQQSYIPLTVWNPRSHAAYVMMSAVFTWQAFNPFGGYDLYQGATYEPGYPPPNRSRVVSFDRPYGYGNGAADFLTIEYPLIRFMEKHGLDVTYWTNITLAVHGNLLPNHKVLISPGHDEEWSTRMRANVVAAEAKGVNLIFFGASPILRKVRLAPSPLGPNLEMVNYRDPTADPLYGKDNAEVTQNWWGQPPADAPASEIVGDTYIGYNNNQSFPLVVSDAHSWLYAGTGLHNGQQIPNVLRYDFDGYDTARPNPPGVQILAHSPVIIGFDGTKLYADTTYVTDRTSGAGVFESGTNEWIADMVPCGKSPSCPAPLIRRMTGNILKLFGIGPTGRTQPSVANWQRFYPPGSPVNGPS